MGSGMSPALSALPFTPELVHATVSDGTVEATGKQAGQFVVNE
jgi:hypothetical protein